MRHCVASYDRVCRRGVCTLWSMRCFDAAGEERRLTIDVLPRSRYVLEALGPCNRRATDEERAILSLWAQRESLQLARRL